MKGAVQALGMSLALAAHAGTPDGGTPGGTPVKSSPVAVTTSKAARTRFERFATEQIFPRLEPEESAELTDLLRGRPTAAKVSCRALGRTVGEGSLLFGTAAALDRPGSCWRLVYDGGLRSGLSGCLDAASGSVLAAWRIPEG